MYYPSCVRRAMLDNLHMPYPDYEPPLCTLLANNPRFPKSSPRSRYYPDSLQEDVEMYTWDIIKWIEDVESVMPIDGHLSYFELEQDWEARQQHKTALAWRDNRKINSLRANDNSTSTAVTSVITVVATSTPGEKEKEPKNFPAEPKVGTRYAYVENHRECACDWPHQEHKLSRPLIMR